MTESLAWICSRCGHWCWNHHENCGACGQQKPAPPPAETPGNEERPEPPWRLEDVLARLWLDVAKGMIDRAAADPAFAAWLREETTGQPE